MKMPSLRPAPLALSLLLACAAPAFAQVSINFSTPGATIGVNLGSYPTLQPIPGYPVYYAPGMNANYFFYDGMYWVYQNDNWYASSWYNGPWGLVDPYYVPDYVLRVPVRYYRRAPVYFRGWRADAAPHWNEHWGRGWEESRRDWNRWDRKNSPAAAPLPAYQRDYRGDRYPRVEQQADLQYRNYRYQPRDVVAREHYQERRSQYESSRNRQDYRGPDNRSQDYRSQDYRGPDYRGQDNRSQEAQRQGREQQAREQQAREQQAREQQARQQQARPQQPAQRPPQDAQGREGNETQQQRAERLGAGG